MAEFKNPFSSPKLDPAAEGATPVSDARRLSARILLVLACLFFAQATCCAGSICLALGVGKAGLEGKLAAGVGLLILVGLSLGIGAGLLVLRKLILGFNQVAALIAAILAGLLMCVSLLGLVLQFMSLFAGSGLPGMIGLAISGLWTAAFAQLLIYLVQVIKEGKTQA